jgi:hypothetical protein
MVVAKCVLKKFQNMYFSTQRIYWFFHFHNEYLLFPPKNINKLVFVVVMQERNFYADWYVEHQASEG